MSAVKKYYWLKLKTDFFNQREVKKLRKVAGGDTFTIIYLKMQLLSIKTEGVITFERTEAHLDEQLALELDEELEDVRMTLSFLHANGLIEPISNDDFLLSKVPGLIGSETSTAERVRKHRELANKRKTALPCNTDETKSNTEIEIEIEIEKELEIEREEKNANPKFIPPTLDDLKDYHSKNKMTFDVQKFFEYFSEGDWIDSHGNPVLNWKQKMHTWQNTEKAKPAQSKKTFTVEKEQKYTEEELEEMLLKKEEEDQHA